MPHRAVIDPNVFISALMAKPGSPNSTIAHAVTTGKLTLVACPALLQELSNVAHRERFAGGSASRIPTVWSTHWR
ncbi:MAG: PIN domain-containing protein [Pseudonocardiaceae bacterium]